MKSRIRKMASDAWFQTRTMLRVMRARLTSAEAKEKSFKKKYFAEVPVDVEGMATYHADEFPPSGPQPWLDHPDADKLIREKISAGELKPDEITQIQKWHKDGYVILPKLLADEELDRVWASYEAAVKSGKVVLEPEKASDDDPYPGRFLNPHLQVPEIKQILEHSAIKRWNEILLGREQAPFQTITAHKGSQQLEHSDSIHMTTYPIGFLTAVWIAFEDIHPDSGPLVYYPGSHRLPYLFSKDLGIPRGTFGKNGYRDYEKIYEPAIQRLIKEKQLTPEYFYAKKGDVLIWHANLIHGGSKRKHYKLSRKSIVCHYFARGAVCYHDLAGVRADSRRTSDYSDALKDMLM